MTGISRRQLFLPSAAVVPQPKILPRSEWADGLPAKGKIKKETPKFLLVHHTADGNGVKSKAKVRKLLRGYYKRHTGVKKWPDIAYNFLIDQSGRIWEGRTGSLAGPVRGDATGGNQGSDQLVCLIGNFMKRQPTKAQYNALVKLLAWLATEYGINVNRGKSITITSRGSNRWKKGKKVKTYPIAGHRDMSLTACPGDKFYPRIKKKLLPDVRARVAKYKKAAAGSSSVSATTTIPEPTLSPTAALTLGGFGWILRRRMELMD